MRDRDFLAGTVGRSLKIWARLFLSHLASLIIVGFMFDIKRMQRA